LREKEYPILLKVGMNFSLAFGHATRTNSLFDNMFGSGAPKAIGLWPRYAIDRKLSVIS